MSLSLSQKIRGLSADVQKLASATGAIGWDREPEELIADPTDLGAKPIPKSEWMQALVIATELAQMNPLLDAPVPGADPDGFVWLTWAQGNRGLALEVRKGAYKWTQRDSAGKKTITSDSLQDVAESMRTVFVRLPMSFCPSCVKDVGAVASLNARAQIVEFCPHCEHILGGGALSAPMAATGKQIGETEEQLLPVKAHSRPPAEVFQLPGTRKAGPNQTESLAPAGDVIGMIRNRLVYLESEIAKRAGLETEAKKLRKMLAAADRHRTDEG